MKTKNVLAVFAAAICFLSSCNKDESNSIVGTWNLTSTEYYFDDAKLDFDVNTQKIHYQDTDKFYVEDIPMQASVTFTKDGSVTVAGFPFGTWKQEGETVTLTMQYGGTKSSGRISNGIFRIENIISVYSYGIAGINVTSIPKMLGYDGKLHSLTLVQTYTK